MRRRKLRFSSRAAQDIQEVLAYTLSQFGEQKHAQDKELIGEALADIAADPESISAKRRPDLHPDAWTFHIVRSGRRARHLLLYRVSDETVDIGRLLYDSMDLKRRLPGGLGFGK